MKRFFSHVMLVAAAATAFFSCQKQAAFISDATEEVILTVTAEKPSFVDKSKTEWNGSTIEWSEGDKISVAYTLDDEWKGQYKKEEGQYTIPKLYKSQALASNTEVAKFDVSVDFKGTDASAEGQYVFYGVYPAPQETDFPNAPEVMLEVPKIQTPKTNSFDGKSDLMIGASVEEYLTWPTGKVSMLWTRLVAHANITLKALNGVTKGETLSSIKLTVQNDANDANIVGKQKVDLLTCTVAKKDGETTNVLEINAGNLSIDDGGNVEFWACILPETITSLSVVVETDKATYTRDITGISKTFVRNARNLLSIKMSDATRTAKTNPESWKLVKSGEKLVEGTYVLVVKNTNSKNYTGALDSSNGSSSAPSLNQSINVDGDVLTGVGASIQFDMSIVDGGYKFAVAGQTSNYLYTTNTNNGVRVGTNTNNIWTLTPDTDHPDAYTFKCNATSRFLGVYETNPDWRCYTSATTDNIKDRNSEIYLYKKTFGSEQPEEPETPKPVLAVENGAYNVSAKGETITVVCSVTNPLENISITSSIDVDWITYSKPETKAGEYLKYILSFDVAKNDGLARKAEITLSYGDADPVEVTVNQEGTHESLPVGVKNIKDKATSTTEAAFAVTLEDAVVTFVSGNNAYIEDAEAGILVYQSNHGLKVGDKLNGEISGKVKLYSGLREITAIDYSKATKTIDAEIPITVLTLEQLNAEGAYDRYENMRIKIVDATVSSEKQLSQNNHTYSLYFKNTVTGFEVDNIVDVIGYPSKHNSSIQLNVWENAVFKGACKTTFSGVSDVTVKVNETKVINAVASSGAKVSYVSANTEIATVDEDGNVTGLAEGETTITVSVPAYNGYPAAEETCKVTVTAAEQGGGEEPADVYVFTADDITSEGSFSKGVVNDELAYKLGSSSKTGTLIFPAGYSEITLYAVGWTTGTNKLTIENGTIVGQNSVTLKNDAMASGNPQNGFKMQCASPDGFAYTINVTDITKSIKISLKRGVVWGFHGVSAN